MDQSVVLLKTVLHQVTAHDKDEVEVECSVRKEVDDLLTAIPPLVDVNIIIVDLKSCRDPDVVYGDVDGGNEDGNAHLESPCEASIRNE